MFFVQRQSKSYISENISFSLLVDAENYSNKLDVGLEPEAIRIVDDAGKVCSWVSRNGWLPSGALRNKKEINDN